jgi:hypothetical protein
MTEYPHAKAEVLEDYVIRHFRMSAIAWHLYVGLRRLERAAGNRFCTLVYVSYVDIVAATRIDKKSVRKALVELQTLGLIKLQIGKPILADGQGTSFVRTPIEALRGVKHPQTEDASRLAALLSGRVMMFEGAEVRPKFTVSLTGRVCSSHPNIQGMKAQQRMEGLAQGVPAGFALFYADIKQAEPTVIKHIMGMPAHIDLYEAWMAATGDNRAAAKIRINGLAYTPNAEGCVSHWPTAAQEHPALKTYVNALCDLRTLIHTMAKKARHVTTLSGRSITWGNGIRMHKGMPLNWKVQGSVADIVNAACLDLLDDALALLPVHDAIYAVLPVTFGKEHVANLLKQHAQSYALRIDVKSVLTVPETDTLNASNQLSIPETGTAFSFLTPPLSAKPVPVSGTQYH